MFLLLVLLATIAALGVFYLRHKYSHWERHGVPYDKLASIPFGSLTSVSKRQKSMGMAIHDVYVRSKERFVGVYLLYRPGILVRDAELARRVLAQDFASFHDRGVYVDEENDPFSGSLFVLNGQSWRSMRNMLSPCFTSGKLKGMFSTSEDISNKMIEELRRLVPKQGSIEVDLKDVLNIYAIDIVASTIFGLDINSYRDPNNKFRALIGRARRNSTIGAIFGMFIFFVPQIARFLFVRLGIKNPVATSLNQIVKDTIEYREKHNIVRKDMLQLLMQLRNTGNVSEDDTNWNIQINDGRIKSLSLELITAQLLIFYLAGQETTASTPAFTLFELSQYPELLAKAVKEVDETLKKHDGQITYESLQQMEFLELCLQETLRKYPGLPLLNRQCTADYKIPDSNVIIEKGTPILISLYGIQRDAEYFPEPENYIPERFLESKHNYNPHAYMPFGEGPRGCIAQRMGRMNSKLAIVKILQNFNVEIMSKRQIEVDNHSVGIVPKSGVKVRLTQRNAQKEFH